MNKPIKKYRSGSIECAVWLNERELDNGAKVGFKTVSLSRGWKDNKDIWRNESINLRKGDIAKAMLVLQKAQEEVLLSPSPEEDENDD